MKIYHGTKEGFLARLRTGGLRPRGRRRTNWDAYPSRKDMVYLSTVYPFYFALHTKGKGRALVLEIETDELEEDRLYPDEDFVAGAIAYYKEDVSVCDIVDEVRAKLGDFREAWRESIAGLGNCCYKGVIPVRAIKRACFLEPDVRPWLTLRMVDQKVSILNFACMSALNLELVSWMFGDTPELTQLPVESHDRTGIEVTPFAEC
jgi:hypothetical protein